MRLKEFSDCWQIIKACWYARFLPTRAGSFNDAWFYPSNEKNSAVYANIYEYFIRTVLNIISD